MLLKQIQNRVTHIQAKRVQAVDILMNHPRKMPGDYRTPVSLEDLERNVAHWQFLIPDDVVEKAHLIHQVSQQYAFNPSQQTTIAEALGVHQDAVQAAYREAYGADIGSVLSDEVSFQAQAASEEPADDLLNELEWRFLRRGDVLYRQGEASDALYGVIEGRLRSTIREIGKQKIMVEVHQGEIIGEEAIISGAKRASTVVALRDCDLFYLTPQSYERLVVKYPSGMARLGMQLVRRIQRIAGVEPSTTSTQMIMILPASPGIGDFGRRLSQMLGQTLYLKPGEWPDSMPDYLKGHIEDTIQDYEFVDWLQTEMLNHEFVLFEGAGDYPNWTIRAIEQADRILLVGRIEDAPDLSPIEALLEQVSQPDLIAPCDLILLHPSRSLVSAHTMSWLENRQVEQHHHVALDGDGGFKRVARFLRGEAVGFVFGGGGMRAAAHIGAIKALHEAGYHADVVGGTSSGAIVAAMYAMGWNADEITAIMREQLLRRNVLVNPTLPIVSLSSAYRFSKALQRVFGDTRAEDLWTTCFTISANMTRTKQSVNQYGLLRHTVRYSTSIAGMFPPAPDDNGDIHIDGGVVDNTPADVMRQFIDGGFNIAIDLGFTEREKIHYNYGEHLFGLYVLWRRLNPFAKPLRAPNILSVLMRANALASINITAEQMSYADLLIQPPVSGYGLFNFDEFDALLDIGYEATQQALRKMEQAEG